jgi:MFS family permease
VSTSTSVTESVVIRKLAWRVMPLLVAGYFIAIIDRANIGVAALTMNDDLGISPAVFGLAAGVFFIPYVLLEIPSNLALARFGARVWLARIMLTWGVFSALHAIVWDGTSFLVLRALLGAAEAGFFPGVIFLLTQWFPRQYRGRMMAIFTTGIPIALVIGTPLSGLLLNLEGALGLAGWQWLFIIEGIPAIVLAVLIFLYLPRSPEKATFLNADERQWLTSTLERERAEFAGGEKHQSVWRMLVNPRILVFAIAYYGLTNLNGAISTFLPQILGPLGFDTTGTTFIAAVPYAFGLLGMIALGRYADRAKRRSDAVYLALGIAIVGLVGSALAPTPLIQFIALCVAAIGVFGVLPAYWGVPTALMGGAAAAGSIAFINAFGNLSSVVNPAVIGSIKESTGTFQGGLLWLAAMGVVAVIALTFAIRLAARQTGGGSAAATGSGSGSGSDALPSRTGTGTGSGTATSAATGASAGPGTSTGGSTHGEGAAR